MRVGRAVMMSKPGTEPGEPSQVPLLMRVGRAVMMSKPGTEPGEPSQVPLLLSPLHYSVDVYSANRLSLYQNSPELALVFW